MGYSRIKNSRPLVLIADDDADVRAFLRAILKRNLYAFAEAATGRESLAIAQEIKPPLVLLDVGLPDVSGFDICRKIKADPALVNVCVVLISGQFADADSKVAGLNCGADDYITKPFEPRELVARVKTALRIQKTEAALRAAHEDLERRVLERTSQLALANEELRTEIAERRRAETVLQESETRFRTSIENMLDGFAIFRAAKNREGEIVDFVCDYINDAGCRSSRIKREQVAGKRLLEVFPWHRDSGLFDRYRKVLETGRPIAMDSFPYEEIVGGQKQARACDIRACKLGPGLAVCWRDTTHRQQIEQTLRELSHRLLDVQETERRRVARELHDGVNQLLASASFRLQTIQVDSARHSEPLAAEIRVARKLVETGLQEVRRISQNLRPSELDLLGLVPALRSMSAEFQERTGIQVELRCSRFARRFSIETKLAFYRIVQEALNNVEKHARATQVKIGLRRETVSIRLEIVDDGKGFHPKNSNRKRKSGFGLVSMRERATIIGGTLAVTSTPQHGTRVVAAVPIARTGNY